ncbi:hypothetical protein TraAM80_10009 [Trypanosoma rangeli]|uniref:Uncharacterized protein n=1 Tax=Trypanosoma rangeli TaxID=5698 RepID=A0A3R7LYI3_TRYRA|nr:uncharacterized protein TraAM80_10009 [Trypanosoma rangeli]RNE96072.1 hypothetical protein TraAM80_10009 [Trypanosoma rangeli]|eukprot:RNE96072.1 hypothetical protein TraAM80_10009 [Trypanosoma rangeli]
MPLTRRLHYSATPPARKKPHPATPAVRRRPRAGWLAFLPSGGNNNNWVNERRGASASCRADWRWRGVQRNCRRVRVCLCVRHLGGGLQSRRFHIANGNFALVAALLLPQAKRVYTSFVL